MAQEALIMIEETVYQLKNRIEKEKFINCCSKQLSPDVGELTRFLSNLKKLYNLKIYIEIDIRGFEACVNEEDEVKILLELINKELNEKGLAPFQKQAYSMATALTKWGETLENQVLLVFHCFHDRYNEKEKDILRSLRRTLRDKDELSSYLGILIISNRKVSSWELFPESNLDERHVAFVEY